MAKTSNDFIKQYVESFGYKLLNEVSGSKETMQLMCPNGHKWEINFGDFKYGRRCSYCKIEKKKQEQLQEIKELMEKEGYELLEKEFEIILKQMELIGANDVDDYSPMVFPFDVTVTYLRDDDVVETISTEEALSNAKDVVENQIRLPKVVL